MIHTSQKLTESLSHLRNDLRLLFMEDFEKATRRLKLSYYTSGNKEGKLLANKLKGQRYKTQIPFIKHPITHTKHYHPQQLADAFSQYYSSLYNIKDDTTAPQPTPEIITSFLKQISLPKRTQDHFTDLNSPITNEEVKKIISALPTNTSPGPDGFTSEYYKTFQDILSPHLVRMFDSAAASSSFPPDMLQALIVALPKPGKEPDSPQNFRPISLLNNDIKIYAKLLAERLVNILPSLIDIDQSGFTTGRQAADATRRLIDFIHVVGGTSNAFSTPRVGCGEGVRQDTLEISSIGIGQVQICRSDL